MNAQIQSGATRRIRIFAWVLLTLLVLFLVNRYLVFWQDWPSLSATAGHFFSEESSLEPGQLTYGFLLIALYLAALTAVFILVSKNPDITLLRDSKRFQGYAYFVVRAAFWSVFLIGLTDAFISFLRVEDMLIPLVGADLAQNLDQARDRGLMVHYPLIVLSIVIASLSRSLGFIWLAFLVVLAEFAIVLSRFIFSYEQALMGDLVRFWYAGLFLFASAYTLVEGGHVRVDVLYAGFNKRSQARVNAFGSLLLGLPLCWTILTLGMGSPQASLIAPILSFEISQSGYGMYVKYLMAGFLIVFAVSMAIQFISYFLESMAILRGEKKTADNTVNEAH